VKRLPMLVLLLLTCSAEANAQTELPTEMQKKIDKVAMDAISKTGVPSASVAIVKDGQIAYLHAYGSARLDPETPANPEMRYSIGSISKQFTAAALLLLQEQGKLSLDDKVSKIRSRPHSRR
jgi:D-alanyl-D-alanine carboxypeptidase